MKCSVDIINENNLGDTVCLCVGLLQGWACIVFQWFENWGPLQRRKLCIFIANYNCRRKFEKFGVAYIREYVHLFVMYDDGKWICYGVVL